LIFTSETIIDGVSERHFTLDDIPGVLWAPAGKTTDLPLILLGHGGGQDKTAPGIVGRAGYFARAHDFAAVAIDAPGHGGRPRTEREETLVARLRERMTAREPAGEYLVEYHRELIPRAVAEWRATLDALVKAGIAGRAPIGYWGFRWARPSAYRCSLMSLDWSLAWWA
jgi:pimeloyl-ACP methyl ester carboxylesterase